MKKVLLSLLVVVMILTTVGCGSKSSETLLIYAFTDEMETIINDYYLVDNPNLGYDIEVVTTATENYQTKLDGVLVTGKNAPDVILLEQQYALKYLETDYLMSLDSDSLDLADTARESQYDYTIEFMEKDGENYGLAWQVCPGAFFYRRSIALEVLGSDDPEVVQAAMSTWEDFEDLAVLLTSHENDYRIMSSLSDASKPMLASRSTGWFDSEWNFTIDEKVDDYLNQLYFLQNEDNANGITGPLINETTVWADGWFSDMSGDTVFGYFLPTWGLHYLLKPNAESSDGSQSSLNDWGVVEGPQAYFDGGTWLTIREGSTNVEAAKDLIEYVTLNEDFLARWAEDTGDFVNNMDVISTISETASEEFLGGQNHYEIFDALAKDINTSIVTGYDMDILSILDTQAISFACKENNLNTIEDVYTNFKIAIKNSYPDAIIG